MRLLWEEDGFELVGAFCVAGIALGAVWLVLEGAFGLSSVAAGLLAAGAAAWTLEAISRRHYAGSGTPAARPASTAARPAAFEDSRAGRGRGGSVPRAKGHAARRAEAPTDLASAPGSRPPTTVGRPATEAGRAAAGERHARSSRAA